MAQQNQNIIRITNPSLESNARTYLTADVAAAATALSVLSTSGFTVTGTADYYVLVGDYGQEKSEIRLVDANGASTNTTGFTTDAIVYAHTASESVTHIRYNQVRIYGMTASGGTKNLITTISIDPTQQYTEYEYDSSTYSYFVTAYYNSNDDEFSEYSDEFTITSFGITSAKKIINSALKKSLSKIDEGSNSLLNWDTAIDILNDGLEEIMSRKLKWEFLHKISSGTNTTASTAYISKPTDMAKIEHLIINNRICNWISRLEYDGLTKSGTVISTGEPESFTIKNNLIYLYPTPSSAYAIIYEYFSYPTEVESLVDTVPRPFITTLLYYCAAHFSWIRGNDKRGDKMYSLYEKELIRLVEEWSGPDQLGDSEYVERTSAYSTDDDYLI